MKQFQQMPDYLGTAEKVVTKAMDGKIFADLDGKLIEVVNVGASELAKLPYSGLSEGFYAVGTGSTGASEALAIMGAGYFSVIMLSALCIRNPHPSYVVPGMEVSSSASSSALAKIPDVTVDDTMKTPQFHLLGATLFCVGTAGMGLLSVAKPMMSEVFSTLLPALVTSAFASKFLLMLSAGNLGKYYISFIDSFSLLHTRSQTIFRIIHLFVVLFVLIVFICTTYNFLVPTFLFLIYHVYYHTFILQVEDWVGRRYQTRLVVVTLFSSLRWVQHLCTLHYQPSLTQWCRRVPQSLYISSAHQR